MRVEDLLADARRLLAAAQEYQAEAGPAAEIITLSARTTVAAIENRLTVVGSAAMVSVSANPGVSEKWLMCSRSRHMRIAAIAPGD